MQAISVDGRPLQVYRLAEGYVPFPKQVAFHASGARFLCGAAGNRGGKTTSGAVEFLVRVFTDIADPLKGKRAVDGASRLVYWVVSATTKLLQYPYEEIKRMLPRELVENEHKSVGQRVLWIKGGARVEFISADNPDRLVGASLNGLWIDEACLVKGGAWEGNLRARIADQQGWAIFTSTPEGGRANWLYQQIVSKVGVDEHIASFSWTTEENPHVPRSEIEHAKANTDERIYARKWCASWDSFGGAIYPAFDDAIHVVTPERVRLELALANRPWQQCFKRIIGAIDFGHVSPGCLLVIGETEDASAWVVLDEFYSVGIRSLVGSTRTWYGECQRVMKDFGVTEFFVDAGNDNGVGSKHDLTSNGIPARAAAKMVPLGIERVASALHVNPAVRRPKLRILNNCKNLIREFRTYQYKPAPNGIDFMEEPAPNQSDHALDALRYGCMALRTYDYVEQSRSNNGWGGATAGPYR